MICRGHSFLDQAAVLAVAAATNFMVCTTNWIHILLPTVSTILNTHFAQIKLAKRAV